jgi:hypothetical protein
VAFAGGTISATGGNQHNSGLRGHHNKNGRRKQIADKVRSATFKRAVTTNDATWARAGDGAYIVAGGAVTPAVGITVTVGAGGTAGTSGAAGGSAATYGLSTKYERTHRSNS